LAPFQGRQNLFCHHRRNNQRLAFRLSGEHGFRGIVKDYSDHGRDQIRSLPYIPAFTGVAMSTHEHYNNRLYVADFQNNMIRGLDNQWSDITVSVSFARPPGMPVDFSPFNIQLLGTRLYVAFAALDTDSSRLNSPWGRAIAPPHFGPFGGALLVGNFGDGTIAVFDLTTGKFRDYLRDVSGQPIVLDGLWGFGFRQRSQPRRCGLIVLCGEPKRGAGWNFRPIALCGITRQ
jgi:hypothetical protein